MTALPDSPQRVWLADLYQLFSDDVHNVIRFRLRPVKLVSMADDILQDVFLTAYDKYDSLTNHPDIRRWLFSTANFKCKNLIRKQAAERKRILWDDGAYRPDPPDPSAEHALVRVLEEPVDYKAVVQRMKECMTNLDLQLYGQVYEDKVPIPKLASLHGISEAAMKMRISRLRRRMLFSIKNILYNMLQALFRYIL